MAQDPKIIKTKHSLKSFIISILFFLPIIGMWWLVKIEPLTILFLFGIQITIFGQIIISKKINTANNINIENTWILVFPVLGLTLTIYSGINIWYSKNNFIFPGDWNIVFVICTFLFLGLGILFSIFYINKIKKENCCINVIAICIALNQNEENQYAPIFKYIYKRVEYKVTFNHYSSDNKFNTGTSYEIYINPSNPKDIYIPDLIGYISGLAFGIFVIFVSCTVIYAIAIQN